MYCLRNENGYFYVVGRGLVVNAQCALIIPRANIYWEYPGPPGATVNKVFERINQLGLEVFRADPLHDRLLTFEDESRAQHKALALNAQAIEVNPPQIYTTADKEYFTF